MLTSFEQEGTGGCGNGTDTGSYPFLRLVAKDLVARFGTRLAEVTVVFPSRRARLFFNNYLYAETGSPLWAPQYATMEELFESRSAYRNADMLQLTGDLYQSYLAVRNARSEIPSTETLDEFFFFGEILLNDFDDLDKNLINARALFSNLKDLDRMKDDFSHLSEAQSESINRHFGKIFKEDTPLKTAFWSIWNILGDVYQAFREKLKERKVAYPGMLMRDVIENETIEFPCEHYVFAGFNLLNRCEQRLFERLKSKSLFYWDYDVSCPNREAGRYIAENIRRFGSALEVAVNAFPAGKKEITLMASSSESGQSGVIPAWIDSLNHSPGYATPDSAIVLCNEDLLPVVMHAISPEKVENVNITMGFPIMQTPIAVFLQLWAELQTKGLVKPDAFYYKQVLPALRHPYTQLIFPGAEETAKTISRNNIFFPDSRFLNNALLFRHTTNAVDLAGYLLALVENVGKAYKNEAAYRDIYDGLYQESIFRAYQVLNRLSGLLSSGEWTLEKPTFLRLLRRLLSATQVPFHGEPVKGLQIMGFLETRALDFKHLLILSVNEGFMPGSNHSENTFIPQFLRSHLGLNTVDRLDSTYACHFYRLLQRAEKITLVYNTDKTQTGKAEMSRFLLQMLVDSQLNIRRYTLLSAVKPMDSRPLTVPKTDEVIRLIKEKYDFNTNPEARPLTPSGLNLFIDCPLRFYLEKIKGYEAPDELSDELDASVFGTIFHRSAELLYREILGGQAKMPFVVQKKQLDVYVQPESEWRIRKFVSKAFEEVYFKGKPVSETQYNGEQLINFRVICKMLERLIAFDRRRTPFTLLGLERKIYDFIELPEASVRLKIGGIIDRLEEQDGKLLVMDYKTGSSGKTYKTLEDLVTAKDRRASHIFQIFVYASVLIRKRMFELPVVPALLYMQDAGGEKFSPAVEYEKKPIEDFGHLHGEFEELYVHKISELFNREIPFSQTAFANNCIYCKFKELCKKS